MATSLLTKSSNLADGFASQTEPAVFDLSVELQGLTLTNDSCEVDWFDSGSTTGSSESSTGTSSDENNSNLPLPRRLAAQIAEVVERWGLEPEDELHEYPSHKTGSTGLMLPMDNLTGEDDSTTLQEDESIQSDASSETSSCGSSDNSSLAEPQRSRYVRREYPTGHRKHQAWIKVSSLLQAMKTQRAEQTSSEEQTGSPGAGNKSISERNKSKNEVSDFQPAKLPVKFRHGRRKKIVYKGPICYNCSGRHHVRDCGLKVLKGKRARKGKKAAERNRS